LQIIKVKKFAKNEKIKIEKFM